MAILERNDRNSVAYILLNSPETLNSLSDEMLAALTREFENLKNDTKIRAVVLFFVLEKLFVQGIISKK